MSHPLKIQLINDLTVMQRLQVGIYSFATARSAEGHPGRRAYIGMGRKSLIRMRQCQELLWLLAE